MDFSDFKLIRLTQEYEIKEFDCGDNDLNEYLSNDAKEKQSELFSVTYILEKDEKIVAFFSLLNDKISVEELINNVKPNWNRLNRRIPNRKKMKSYPAMKIGRFAVNLECQGKGIGNLILDYIKFLFIENNRTGCRFITLDGYRKSLDFYSRNGFKFLTNGDLHEETRLMYFDLKTLLQ